MPKYKIEWDKETNTITCGNLVVSKYTAMCKDNFYSKVTNGKPLPSKPHGVPYTVHVNKCRCDEFETSFVAEYQHFMRLQYKAFVSDIPKVVVNNYAKVWFKSKNFHNGIIPGKISFIRSNLDLINQVVNDGNTNILPFVMTNCRNTQELKEYYGKGLWKKLCKNTHSRNLVISKSIDVEDLYKYPTSVIKIVSLVKYAEKDVKVELAEWYTKYYKGKWTKLTSREILDIYHLVMDTKLMASQLGYKFTLDMDHEALKNLHDKYAKAIRDKQYSSEPFEWLVNIPKQHIQGDYLITLLDNPKVIREEGDVMKHCVASYINLVHEKEYLVYSVMKNGEKVSTVGYYKTNDGWEIQRQYGKCNSRIQDDAEKFIALEMLNKINEICVDNRQYIVYD